MKGILVDYRIRQFIEGLVIGMTPYDPACIQPNSYDLHLGRSFIRFNNKYTIDPYSERSVRQAMSDPFLSDGPIKVGPGEFILASTTEKIRLPADIVGSVEGKSSLARLGISIHQTGGWIDGGFEGTITLEIANVNICPVLLYPGMPIAQIVFQWTEGSEIPYCKRETAKYNGQSGATPSRFWQNEKPGGNQDRGIVKFQDSCWKTRMEN